MFVSRGASFAQSSRFLHPVTPQIGMTSRACARSGTLRPNAAGLRPAKLPPMSSQNASTSIDAGPFAAWRHAIRTGAQAAVPCGDCNACCRSSYFIHIRGSEQPTLDAVPQAVRFMAPGRPGDQVMGYDEEGRCPMLQEGRCSIYPARPQTCREYDCRIFAACDISAGDADKAAINERVARWQFTYPQARDRQEHAAVLEATVFIRTHAGEIEGLTRPLPPAQLALLAIEVADLFLPESRCDDDAKLYLIEASLQTRGRANR